MRTGEKKKSTLQLNVTHLRIMMCLQTKKMKTRTPFHLDDTDDL